jgi:hypothetical protein
MADLPIPSQPPPVRRVADADREAVARLLRDAATEGRLDLTELEERLGAVYSAKTQSDLDALTVDLPSPQSLEIPPLKLWTKSGTVRKHGYWMVPSSIAAECTSGFIKLDFTEADCPHRVVDIQVSARSGSVVLVVPKGWSVDLDQVMATSGSVVNKVRDRPEPGAPLLRVGGKVTSGTIRARYPRRSFWDWLLGRRAEGSTR